MEFSNLFVRVLELSPFVAALLYFLFTVWNSMQKKDEAMQSANREHQASMLQMQRESIMAQNNSADATRQLAGVLTDFKADITSKIDELKPNRNGTVRKLPTGASVNPSASA